MLKNNKTGKLKGVLRMAKVQTALISVSDKRGIVELAEKLQAREIKILSTGGTAGFLKDNNIRLTLISDYTHSPEMLDGRVKTLHPKIHAGLLAKRDNPEHRRQLEDYGWLPIDLVVVNLYPFEQTIAKESFTFSEAIENIDIGGPTMLRAAAKNFQDVAVVVDPSDYPLIIQELEENLGEIGYATKFFLMKKTFAHTAHYDGVITQYLNRVHLQGNTPVVDER